MPRTSKNQPTADRRVDAARAALAARIAQRTAGPVATDPALPGLSLFRLEQPSEPMCSLYGPSVCVIAQGAKRILLGDDVLTYDADHYLITSVGLPVLAQVVEASPGLPYLGLKLNLDLRAVVQLTVDVNLPLPRGQSAARGMAVGKVTPELLNALERYIDLLDRPQDIPVLAPLIEREILYRLLVGEQGLRLRQIAAAGSHDHQIARALEWLKENFAASLRVDDLAERATMSTSTFHHHFRAMTAMSPLQYQKSLRLHEARRLMLADGLDASSAAFRVGYESSSQFSREYRRLFGAPPLRDVRTLQRLAAAPPA